MRYKKKSINRKALNDSQSIDHWTILPQCPVLRRQALKHLTRITKEMEQLLDPQVLKTIIKK